MIWATLSDCLQVDTLKVGWCNIEHGDGAKAVSDLLMHNQTLVTVDLRGNKLVRACYYLCPHVADERGRTFAGKCTDIPVLLRHI
jgi:hypothetical protein